MLSGCDLGTGWVLPVIHARYSYTRHMSVRQNLLAILDQGPCYGYQLRAEFGRRTGSAWSLNVGQIYTTLERLERDGLVAKADIDEQGHVYWRITDAGRAEVHEWLRHPVEPSARDELAIKLAVAVTLPGLDVGAVIETQRRASTARLAELQSSAEAEPETPEDLARVLVVDALAAAAEAEVRWLDRVTERLARHPDREFALSADLPKRGRPVRATASA